MLHNPENRCLHKLRVEDKILDLDMNDRCEFIEHHLTDDEKNCHYCCNGYNHRCADYLPVSHYNHFYQIMKVG